MAAYQSQPFNYPVLVNESGQPYRPLNVGLFRQLGINRAHVVDQALLLNARWHVDWLDLSLQEIRERQAATGDGSQFATHTAKSTDTGAACKVAYRPLA